MDTAEIVVLAVGSLLVLLTLWFFFGGRDNGGRDNGGRVDAARANSAKPLYACPMHPWITSRDPAANCSICGMKLTSYIDDK